MPSLRPPRLRQHRLAPLVEAVGRGYGQVPRELTDCVMAVVGAVDQATRNWRTG